MGHPVEKKILTRLNCRIRRLSSGCRRRIAAHHPAASGCHPEVSEDQNHFRRRWPRIFIEVLLFPVSSSSSSCRESMSSLSMSLLSSHGSRNVWPAVLPAVYRSGQQMFGAPSPNAKCLRSTLTLSHFFLVTHIMSSTGFSLEYRMSVT